jgi:hypothetical protein
VENDTYYLGTLYSPTAGNERTKADPSILAHGKLTIGYGDGGTPPQAFKLKADEPVGVTYFKVFFGSQYVDLSWIAQDSPFGGNGRKAVDREEPLPVDWGTQQLAIIQTRPGTGAVGDSALNTTS